MQKEKTINSNCSFSKRAKSAILDTLISVFASVLLMILSVFLYTKTPVYQEEYEQISQSMNQITELVSESRLNEGILNEDGTYTIKTASELTKDFVNSLLYQKGLEVDAEKYQDNKQFKDLDPSKDYDVLTFYYKTYYPENQEKYLIYDETKTLTSFQTKFFEKINNKSFSYLTVEEDHFVIQSPYYEDFLAYIDGDTSKNVSFCDVLINAYEEILRNEIEDYKITFQPYLRLSAPYKEMTLKQNKELISTLAISQLVALFLLFFIIPLFLGEHQTLMQRVFHQVRVDRSGKPVKWYQLLIIFLVRFMTTLWTLFANVFFFFGASKGTSLVNTPVLFSIPFLYILFFSLALCVISLILSFFLKEHTGLEELCSHSVLEDNSEEY